MASDLPPMIARVRRHSRQPHDQQPVADQPKRCRRIEPGEHPLTQVGGDTDPRTCLSATSDQLIQADRFGAPGTTNGQAQLELFAPGGNPVEPEGNFGQNHGFHTHSSGKRERLPRLMFVI